MCIFLGWGSLDLSDHQSDLLCLQMLRISIEIQVEKLLKPLRKQSIGKKEGTSLQQKERAEMGREQRKESQRKRGRK